jgi:hypothetical protein
MYGLSLDQAPPYKLPLLYYIMGASYLVGAYILLFVFSSAIDSRYYYEAIAITHIFTIGFFSHVMFGSLFQMVPVIMGVPYTHVQIHAKVILFALNVGLILFLIGFFSSKMVLIHSGTLFLNIAFIYFAIISFKTVWKVEDKNATVKTFLTSFIFLFISVIVGLIIVIQHTNGFSAIRFNDIHILAIIYGWAFMFISGVAYKVIPMFYVTKEYPLFIKDYNFKFLSILIIVFSFLVVFESYFQSIIKVIISLSSAIFALVTIQLLKERKRPRRDTTVNLWYFSMSNLFVGSILWILSIIFDFNVDILLGIIFGVGFLYGLINGMLYKIIPFLTWFHLSSQGNFEAEMSQVISVKNMRLQFYIFVAGYIILLVSSFFKVVSFIALALLFVSSVLLLKNIIIGYKYYLQKETKAY